MKLIKLSKPHDNSEALETIEELKAKIESGELIGYIAVALGKDDSTYLYTGTTTDVSILRMKGAIMQMLLYHDEVLQDDE